ncbi:hypothetical protein HU200_014175 [Digitaria exilis]|uniref:Uncharacterized protein n=1 Tax=Digitaria exilis TaxID=1010633 RepID=A0A835A7Q7_9POAL|nr:hypothetical protein HU200_061470 [Digitaria exilis]KAF8737278.1 hypothetical protein HU200_014175 [Digitaria exilis]
MMEHALHRDANKRSKLHAPLAAANDGALPTDVLTMSSSASPPTSSAAFDSSAGPVMAVAHLRVSDPTFAKAHSSRHPLVVGLCSVAGQPDHRDNDLEVQFLDPFSGGIVKRIPLGSHRDLIMSAHHCRLFISVGYLPESACVVDPATGSITMLPTTSMVTEHENKTSSINSVLGQVPSTGEYKALCKCASSVPVNGGVIKTTISSKQVTILPHSAAMAVTAAGTTT